MSIKILPHNDTAEESVLGAILIDKNAIVPVSEILKSEDFYSDINGIIYGEMLVLYEERKPIDLLTLTEKLKKSKLLKKCKLLCCDATSSIPNDRKNTCF